MNCREAQTRLDDYLDAALSSAERREVEAHLSGCAACRAELSSIGALLDTAQDLRARRLEPGRELWPGIRERVLEVDAAGAGKRHAWWAWFGLGTTRLSGRASGLEPATRSVRLLGVELRPSRALLPAVVLTAAIVVAASVSLLPRLRSSGRGTASGGAAVSAGADSTAALPPELASLDSQLAKAREEVRGAAATDSSAADSWRLFAEDLGVLDAAIRDSRAALARDPENPVVQRSLLSAYQKQLELLRWASRLVRHG